MEVIREAELWEEVDRRSRERLGISGEEFARRYRAGEHSDMPAGNELGILLSLVGDAFVPE